MKFSMSVLVAVVATAASDVAIPMNLPAQAACKRPAPKSEPLGATVTIADAKTFPCTFKFVATGVVLRSQPDGAVEEIGTTVARGPDGRLYTSMNKSAQVTVWNPDGSFLKNFGARGQGPGEFAVGPKHIFFDPQKRLVIGDNNRRWSVFTPSYVFVRTFPTTSTGSGVSKTTVMLDDGMFLTSFRGQENAFHIIDATLSAGSTTGDKVSPLPAGASNAGASSSGASAPAAVRAFGNGSGNGGGSTRPLAYSKGKAFWAGPVEGAGQGYVIEHWDTNGKLLQTIRRAAPWMPTSIAPSGPGALPPPEMEVLHDDGTGLLYVQIIVPNKLFATLTPAERRDESFDGPMNKAIDVYFEIIDANAGVLLASTGLIHPAEATKMLPIGMIAGTRLGFRRVEDTDGFPSMHILEAKLFAK